MALYPSGMLKNEQLVTIKTEDLYLVISGDLDINRYNEESYKSFIDNHDSMYFSTSKNAQVEIFDIQSMKLVERTGQAFLPLFFENGRYEIQVKPDEDMKIHFYHEYEPFRKSVRPILKTNILSGILHFQNEVGLSNFEIRDEHGNTLLSVVIEVYPSKLDYKKDYQALLDDVSDIVYNLSYDFLKRTYLTGSEKIYKEPTGVEFYRLLERHFDDYLKAVNFVEQKPHRRLETTYEEVRGDRLRKQDAVGRAYLRKNATLFVEVEKGIPLNGRPMMPQKGLLIKKVHTYDTHENRYVKMTLERLSNRIEILSQSIQQAKDKFNSKPDEEIINILNRMTDKIANKLKKPFWKSIGRLDRSVMSVVLQMAAGYRDVYQIYATLSKGIVLSGEIYKMSIKEIALIYEYWTFLKLGKILNDKCEDISQNLIKVKSDGLTLNLDGGAQRTFINKTTGETIRLQYQYSTGKKATATVTQIPDTMLIIEKLGRDYNYMYIFDAKYRINFGNDNSNTGPGPMEDDINTMHRYRDAIVAESEGRYERTAFGAYVLFPWTDQDKYLEHPLYKSIEKVNIGGLPFLPKATALVEAIIDNLLNKTADELQEQGILPKGTKEFLYDSKLEYVLVLPIKKPLTEVIKELSIRVSEKELPQNWKKSKKVVLFNSEGIVEEGIIEDSVRDGKQIVFHVKAWVSRFNPIQSNNYSIVEPLLIEEHIYNEAIEVPELLITSEQRQLWTMLKGKSDNVEIELNTKTITIQTQITSFKVNNHNFYWGNNKLIHEHNNQIEAIPMDDLKENSYKILSELAARI